MRAAANSDASARPVHDLLDALHQLAHVAEPRGPVGVGKERIFAPHVPQAVRDAAAFAPVSNQGHDADDVVESVVAGKVEHHVDRLVAAAVVDDEDLVPAGPLGRHGARRVAPRMAPPVGADGGGPGFRGATDVLVEPGDGLFEGGQDAFLLVVGREDDAQVHLCGLNGAGVGQEERLVAGRGTLLIDAALGEPAVVPAWQLSRRRGRARGARRDVCLLRREGRAGLGGDEVKEDEELRTTLTQRDCGWGGC